MKKKIINKYGKAIEMEDNLDSQEKQGGCVNDKSHISSFSGISPDNSQDIKSSCYRGSNAEKGTVSLNDTNKYLDNSQQLEAKRSKSDFQDPLDARKKTELLYDRKKGAVILDTQLPADFCLTDKILYYGAPSSGRVIMEGDVKEFIKEIQERIDALPEEDKVWLTNELKKIAGDRLI